MQRGDFSLLVVRPFLAGIGLAAFTLGVGWAAGMVRADANADPLWQVAQAFRRPAERPASGKDAPNAARLALGETLFSDTRLSRDGTVSCASCHNPALGFTDGVARGSGIAKVALSRNTPHLWNLAWGESYFWDGRAATLEEQAKGPIENPLEMGQDLGAAAILLRADPAARAQFSAAFPGEGPVSPDQISRALAAWERTLVSPETRFDRWVAGDRAALDAQERSGFGLFVGKAGCSSCHSGWAFTDRAYHDIGLPGSDRGRAAVVRLAAAEHAFRTPGLRELAWTAPYMHDGSLPTLEAVLDHYEHGIAERPSLSPDLTRIALTPDERQALLAFLGTLSSEDPPHPAALAEASNTLMSPSAGNGSGSVIQRDKAFLPAAVILNRGETLSITNDDRRTHNVRLDGDQAFDSGAQEPGQTVRLAFPIPGQYRVYCGIHPAMQLDVVVKALTPEEISEERP